MDYFPYGKELRTWYAKGNERFLSTEHERDVETKLDYRGARMYDSEYALFLGVDPLAGQFAGWNPYHYVHGNPVLLVDPDGRMAGGPGGGDPPSGFSYEEDLKYRQGMGVSASNAGDGIFGRSLRFSRLDHQSAFLIGPRTSIPNTQYLLAGTIGIANSLWIGMQEFVPNVSPRDLSGSHATASERLDGAVEVMALGVGGIEFMGEKAIAGIAEKVAISELEGSALVNQIMKEKPIPIAGESGGKQAGKAFSQKTQADCKC